MGYSDEREMGSGPYSGRAIDWKPACSAAASLSGGHKAARRFFEKHFRPYEGRGEKPGKFTGYYLHTLKASRTRHARYQFPLYARPEDLVAVNLSRFIADGRSRRIWGRRKGNRLVPYYTRAEIPESSRQVLLWVDDPADVIAVEIEGSGRAILDDGSVVMVAFAGKTGRKSGRLGSVMRAMREFSRKHGAGPWTASEIAAAEQIANQKTSVVFFEIEERLGAIGSQNVELTPKRSLAVDRAVIALSTPVWVDTRAPGASGKNGPFRQLLIAQDTGGAIRGALRGDIFWGNDERAAREGARIKAGGKMWLLLPKRLSVPKN